MPNPAEIVERFRAAFYEGDKNRMHERLADNFASSGPGAGFDDPETFIKASGHVAPGVKAVETRKLFADGADVAVISDLVIDREVGRMTILEWYRVESDRIAVMTVLFDMSPFVKRGGNPARYAVDPVCYMQVDTADPPETCIHQGKSYYFCSTGCAEAFRNNPETYMTETGTT